MLILEFPLGLVVLVSRFITAGRGRGRRRRGLLVVLLLVFTVLVRLFVPGGLVGLVRIAGAGVVGVLVVSFPVRLG